MFLGSLCRFTLPACCAEPARRGAFKMRRFASETCMGARSEAGLFAHSRRKMSAASALRQVALFSQQCLDRVIGCVLCHSHA